MENTTTSGHANRNSGRTAAAKANAAAIVTALIVLAIGMAMAGCSVKPQVELPKTELPKKPYAAEVPCEDLSEIEDQACMSEGPEARNVCRKVQKNKMICDGNQSFVDRLYSERDGK